MDPLGLINGAIELAKKVNTATAAVKNAEIKTQLADLMMQLANLKIELATLVTENDELKQKLKASATPPPVTMLEGVYYKSDGTGGPYCPGCFDSKSKFHTLTEKPEVLQLTGRWKCPVCNQSFGEGKRLGGK